MGFQGYCQKVFVLLKVRIMFLINTTVTLGCMVWAQAPQCTQNSEFTSDPPIKGKYSTY